MPLVHWSAESDKENSHLNAVECVQWLPKNVWFSHDSAYPKQNMFERQVQLISCAGDKSVLVWSLRKPSADDDDDDEMMDEHMQPAKGGDATNRHIIFSETN